MGMLKPILKIGKQTILKRVINLFRESGIEDVIVVVGHRANELVPEIVNCGARPIVNEHYESGMFSSVQVGIKALRPVSKAFFLLPVDIPLVRTQTILDLVESYRSEKSKIIFPTFLGKRGHPPLVSASYRNGILSYAGDEGLRGFFRKHHCRCMEVEVADEMILFDVDTPADYEALVALFRE
jgi:molybdenum cofactor cytidylyltransferase